MASDESLLVALVTLQVAVPWRGAGAEGRCGVAGTLDGAPAHIVSISLCCASTCVSSFLFSATSPHSLVNSRCVSVGSARTSLTCAFTLLVVAPSTSSNHLNATFRRARKPTAASSSIRLLRSHRRCTSRTFSTNWSRSITSRSAAPFRSSCCKRSARSIKPCEYEAIGSPGNCLWHGLIFLIKQRFVYVVYLFCRDVLQHNIC